MDLIPRPTNLRGGVQKASKGGGSIAPEDTALDEMREVYVDVISPASTGVNLIVPVSDHDSFQRGENGGPDLHMKLHVPGFLLDSWGTISCRVSSE